MAVFRPLSFYAATPGHRTRLRCVDELHYSPYANPPIVHERRQGS